MCENQISYRINTNLRTTVAKVFLLPVLNDITVKKIMDLSRMAQEQEAPSRILTGQLAVPSCFLPQKFRTVLCFPRMARLPLQRLIPQWSNVIPCAHGHVYFLFHKSSVFFLDFPAKSNMQIWSGCNGFLLVYLQDVFGCDESTAAVFHECRSEARLPAAAVPDDLPS